MCSVGFQMLKLEMGSDITFKWVMKKFNMLFFHQRKISLSPSDLLTGVTENTEIGRNVFSENRINVTNYSCREI